MKQFLEAPESNNILVVDDTPANLHLLTDILKKYNYKVRPVPNGKLAISAAEINPPDLILLDIMMPDLNGYQVCQQLKNNEKTREVPIIFITAISEPIDKLKGFSLGGVDYITKPFDVKDVLIRVKNQLGVASLQTKLKSKNAKLNETIHQLQQAQKKIVKSEKSLALDKMISGIINTINFPLSEINTALSDLNHFAESTVENLPEFLQKISPEQHKYFTSLLKQAQESTTTLSDSEKEKQKEIIIKKLEAFQLENTTKIADIFIELSCHQVIDSFLPLLTGKDYLAILENAYLVYYLGKNIRAIADASQQFTKIVSALENYSNDYLDEEKRQAHIKNTIELALKTHFSSLKPGIKITKNYHHIPPIYCYPEALQQAWVYIIDNALKVMGDHGILTISIEKQDNNILVNFTDTGTGISKELVQKICLPFFTTTSSQKSVGLGLSIVKKIVEKHEGTIAVQSIPRKTKITVSLPFVSS